MDKRLFFLLNRAQHSLYKYADAYTDEKIGMTVTQSGVLMIVAQNEGCLQKLVSELLGLNYSAVTGLVTRMKENDLLEVRNSPEDGRAKQLFLTSKGRSKLPEIFSAIKKMNKELTRDFSEEEIETVSRFLSMTTQRFKP